MDNIKALQELYRKGYIGYKVIMYHAIREKVDTMTGKKSHKVRHIMAMMKLSKSTVYRALRMIPSKHNSWD